MARVKRHTRVRATVPARNQYGRDERRIGTILYRVDDPEWAQSMRVEVGTYAFSPDDQTMNGHHVGIIFVKATDTERVKRDVDPLYHELRRKIMTMFQEYGDDMMTDVWQAVLSLDTRCREGSHEWSEKGYDGHGGANERYDCVRKGCNAYVRD
jgi:hypothetical protein